MKDIYLGSRWVGLDHKPYIIAEMSGNHNQSLERALELVEAAAKMGVDALKIQTYTADTMTLNLKAGDFYINDPKSLWYGESLYDLYKKAYTPWEWHEAIFRRGKELGLDVFSTPFDETAVDFLESLEVPFYKIASFENTDLPLIRKVAKTGKPIIISTGMASLSELEMMVFTLKQAGCEQFVLLKCTSAYPASPFDANIRTIPHLSSMFDCHVGLSDHTMGIGVPIAAIALGARVIEKHFCLSRSLGGPDADFSLEPHEFKMLVEESERAWQSLGNITYQCSLQEEKSKQFKRSIYFSANLKKGEKVTKEAIRCIRPGYGLSPKYFDELIGAVVTQDVDIGMRTSWELFVNRSKEE